MPDSFIEHVGFDCANLALESTRGRALRLLETAYEVGIRYFDTAPFYGEGYSERLLGDFLKTHREGVTVATKIALNVPADRSQPAWLALPLNRLRRGLGETQEGGGSVSETFSGSPVFQGKG